MRTFVALITYVSLATVSYGADWAALHLQGRKAFAQRDYRSAVEQLRESWAAAQTDSQRALSAHDLGTALHQLGRDPEARKWLEKSLGLSPVPLAATSEMLASVDRDLGDYAAAEKVLRTALTEYAKTGEERALVLSALGDLLREEGRATESRQLIAEALRIPGITWRREFDARVTLAELDRNAGAWQASQANWKEAAEIAHRRQAAVLEAQASEGLAEVWVDLGNNARAEPLLRGAIAVFENNPELSREVISPAEACLGRLYLSEDKLALAEESIRRALAADEQALGDDHPQVAVLLQTLGDAVARRGQMDLARTFLGRADRIMTAQFGEKSPEAGSVLASWGEVEQRAGYLGEAIVYYERALSAIGASPDLDRLRLRLLQNYAAVLKATHRGREAQAVLAQARGFTGK